MSNTKRWVISSLVTFATGFLGVLVLSIDDITIDSFKDGSFTGIVFVAARAGVKGLVELYLAWQANR